MHSETLVLVAKLVPSIVTLRQTQLSARAFQLSPVAVHEVRRRHRHLLKYIDKNHRAFMKYKWVLPNGRPDGPRLTFYWDLIYVVVYYVNGTRHGAYRRWDTCIEPGNLTKRTTYEHGKMHGPFTIWYQSGGLEMCGEYDRGRLHGTCNSYFRDGRLNMSVTYAFGVHVCEHAG